MDTIVKVLDYIAKQFNLLWQWFYDVIINVFKAAYTMFTDVFLWAFESVLGLVVSIMQSINLDLSFLNPGSYISSMPSDAVQVIGLIRIGEAMAIIVAAIVVKIILQLIPFTRLGS